MQLMHYKQKSQSKAIKNLVEGIPVKERQKLSEFAPFPPKSVKTGKNSLGKMKLDLEISTYWLLSKYVQARRKHHPNGWKGL